MEIRSTLKKVEARANLRDFLRASLWVFTSAGSFFILFGAVDHRFSFSFAARLAITASVLLLVITGLALDLIRKSRNRGALWAAALLEQNTMTLGNQLFTITESSLNKINLPAYMRARIEVELSRKLESITPSRVIKLHPGRAGMLAFLATLAIYAIAISTSPRVVRDEFRRLILFDRSEAVALNTAPPLSETLAAGGQVGIEGLRIMLTPPAYTRHSSVVQIGEGNIVALAGTRADVRIKTDSELAAFLSTGGAPAIRMEREGEFLYSASFVVSEDSNYKISLTGLADAKWNWEGVYSIRAVKDNPPDIHITRPLSDLLFNASNRPESLSIEIAARDDFDVALIKLKYIKTTGEGDASRFESGEININRAAVSIEGQARGSARLDLASLGVAPGTSIVFHAEARDRNNVTGPGVGYSESIIVQVSGPEPIKISLDNLMPDEALKYLTSERMILIKTEKLHRQRSNLSNEVFASRSQEIAFEQRRFRDSFNQFSEIESAHGHTEGDASESPSKDESELEPESAKLRDGSVPDVPTGASESLREMILAIRAMWRAEGALGAADTATAMEFEKEAIAHLKEAQKGARYFTRVVAKSKPVDLKRRYMGVLDGIRSRLERVAGKQESAFDKQLRGALASVYDAARLLAQSKSDESVSSQRLSAARQKVDRAAEELLSIRGEGASLIVESASRLKLLARMLAAPASMQEQDAFGMLVQVASEMSAALGRDERTGTASAAQSLPPTVRAKAAAYFKLLANP